MDISELYVKMCDCPEIQIQRKPKIEKMSDGRWHYEWELEDGDLFATRDLYKKEEMQIEVKGTTIYNPYFYDLRKDANIDISTVGFDEGDGYITKSFIWLPRQDQIQEMMSGGHIWDLIKDFYFFCADIRMSDTFNGKTMEQLWLAFYMHEKYQKIWKDNKWQSRAKSTSQARR